MNQPLDHDSLEALKIAFSYMPKAIEATRFEYGDRYERVLEHISAVRTILELNGVDPEEVYGDVHPDDSPNSCY